MTATAEQFTHSCYHSVGRAKLLFRRRGEPLLKRLKDFIRAIQLDIENEELYPICLWALLSQTGKGMDRPSTQRWLPSLNQSEVGLSLPWGRAKLVLLCSL